MLEDHVIPFLTEWGVGLGFLGEHGAESIHARFNILRRNFIKIPNPTRRLHAIMEEHLLQVCPDNLAKNPLKPTRVFKKPRTSICYVIPYVIYMPYLDHQNLPHKKDTLLELFSLF